MALQKIGLEAVFLLKKFLKAAKQYAKTTDEMEKKTKRSAKSITDSSAVMQRFAGIIGAGAVLYAMKKFGEAALTAALDVQKLTVANERLAEGINATSDEIVASMQDASQGLISRNEALQASNKAMLFGIVENKEEMAELTQIAITLGQAMGQDAGKSVDDLTTALGRNSPMILDNLGIQLKLGEAYEKYAKSIGKSVKALTEEEKKMAFRKTALEEGRKKMEELGGIAENTATDIGKVTSAWDDFVLKTGEAIIATAETTDTLGFLERRLGEAENAMTGWELAIGTFIPMLNDHRDRIILTTSSYKEYLQAVKEFSKGDRFLQHGLTVDILLYKKLYKELRKTRLEEFKNADIKLRTSRVVQPALTKATREYVDVLQRVVAAKGLVTLSIDEINEGLDLQEQAFDDAKEAALNLAETLKDDLIAAYNELRNIQTQYILDTTGIEVGAEDAETAYQSRRVGIVKAGNDAVADADERLKDELEAAEEEFIAIKTQLLGDWDAKGQEQTLKDIAWHQAIYEDRIGEAHVAHAAELKEIEAASTEQTAALAAGYEQQKVDAEAALQEMTILKALSLMEATGALEEITGIQDITAQQAYSDMKAGTIKVTGDMKVELARMITDLEAKRVASEGEQEAASATFKNLMDADARKAKIAADDINRWIGSMATGTVEAESAAGTAFDNMMTDIDAFREKVETALSPEDFEALGKDSIDGIIEGVGERVGALENVMFESGEAALAAYKAAIEGGSPARAFIPLGASMIEGVIVGIEETQHDLTKAGSEAIERAMFDWLNTFKDVVPGFRGKIHKGFKDAVRDVMDDMTVATGETLGEAALRVFNAVVEKGIRFRPEVAKLAEGQFDVVLDILGAKAEQTFFTMSEQLSDVFALGGIFGRVGGTAARMLREAEITPAQERISQMEDELSMLEKEGTELGRQAELIAEIAVERARILEVEEELAALEEQRLMLQLLQDELALMDLIAKHGLDAQEVLGGITLGTGTDPRELLAAMTRAYSEVVSQVQAQAFTPLGYAPGQVEVPAGQGGFGAAVSNVSTSVGGIQFGPITISDQVGLENFIAQVEAALVTILEKD